MGIKLYEYATEAGKREVQVEFGTTTVEMLMRLGNLSNDFQFYRWNTEAKNSPCPRGAKSNATPPTGGASTRRKGLPSLPNHSVTSHL